MAASRLIIIPGSNPATPPSGELEVFSTTLKHASQKDDAGKVRRLSWDPPADLVDSVSAGVPSFFTTHGYTYPHEVDANTVVIGADRPIEWAIWLPWGAIVDQVELRVLTAGATNPTGFIGLYSEDGQTLLRGIDNLDWTGTGTKIHTFAEVTIPPGIVHVVLSSVDAGVAFYGHIAPGTLCIWHGSDTGTVPAGTDDAPATRTPPTGFANSRQIILAFSKLGT